MLVLKVGYELVLIRLSCPLTFPAQSGVQPDYRSVVFYCTHRAFQLSPIASVSLSPPAPRARLQARVVTSARRRARTSPRHACNPHPTARLSGAHSSLWSQPACARSAQGVSSSHPKTGGVPTPSAGIAWQPAHRFPANDAGRPAQTLLQLAVAGEDGSTADACSPERVITESNAKQPTELFVWGGQKRQFGNFGAGKAP